MSDTPIGDAFTQYASAYQLADVSTQAEREVRMAFYAGATAALDEMVAHLHSESHNLARLAREIMTFSRREGLQPPL